eukprot:19090-Heterococcus_DN1.PRE.3
MCANPSEVQFHYKKPLGKITVLFFIPSFVVAGILPLVVLCCTQNNCTPQVQLESSCINIPPTLCAHFNTRTKVSNMKATLQHDMLTDFVKYLRARSVELSASLKS